MEISFRKPNLKPELLQELRLYPELGLGIVSNTFFFNSCNIWNNLFSLDTKTILLSIGFYSIYVHTKHTNPTTGVPILLSCTFFKKNLTFLIQHVATRPVLISFPLVLKISAVVRLLLVVFVMAKLLNVLNPAVCCFLWCFVRRSVYFPWLKSSNFNTPTPKQMFDYFYFLNLDHLSLKFSERIRITTCMWLVVWRLKSNLPRRHFKYSGEVCCCKIDISKTKESHFKQ